MDNHQRRLRVYDTWTGHKGEERFFCYGYLVSGPNWKAGVGSAFLIAAPTGIFLAFVAPYLTRQLSIAIMVFSWSVTVQSSTCGPCMADCCMIFTLSLHSLLPFLSILFLFLTSCRDPGIIPRQEPDREWLAGRKPRTKEVLVNGHKVVVRCESFKLLIIQTIHHSPTSHLQVQRHLSLLPTAQGSSLQRE